jgi:hypothetical protein
MHIPLFSRPIRSRPHNHNRSDKFLRTDLDFEIFGGIMILLFGGTFLCAWDFHFPSYTERILWRCASVYFLVFVVVGGAYTWIWHIKLFDKYKPTPLPMNEIGPVDIREQKGIRYNTEALLSKMREASPTLPLRLLYPVPFICALYCIFRAYIFVEDIISLRALPSSAYATRLGNDTKFSLSIAIRYQNRKISKLSI